MTTPKPTYYASTQVSDTTLEDQSPAIAVRASAVQCLYTQPEFRYDGVDPNTQDVINWRAVYCVYAAAGGLAARVTEFPTFVEANDYVRTDPDGIFTD